MSGGLVSRSGGRRESSGLYVEESQGPYDRGRSHKSGRDLAVARGAGSLEVGSPRTVWRGRGVEWSGPPVPAPSKRAGRKEGGRVSFDLDSSARGPLPQLPEPDGKLGSPRAWRARRPTPQGEKTLRATGA